MDLLTTILTCSLYASDDALVRAIAEGPGESNPYLVMDTAVDPAQGDSAPPTSEREATALASNRIAQGARVLLGLLELPPVWLDTFGRPLPSAFDPCLNIAIGTAMLSEFDASCASKLPPQGERARRLERTNRRACVLRKYEAAVGVVDFAAAVLLELSAQQPKTSSIEGAPILTPPNAHDWGPDQLLVRMPVAAAPVAIGLAPLP
jgi:hypothetical protein